MKFAIIGRRFGRNYARLLNEKGVDFIIVTKEDVHKAFNGDIDCVIIASPAATHFRYIKKALNAKKHVLVEKPMVLSSKEAREVKELIGDRVFMVGHQYLYNDSLLDLVDRIKGGEIGNLKRIKMYHFYPSARKDIDVYWDAASHGFSVLDFMGATDKLSKFHVGIGIKYLEWVFSGDRGALGFNDAPTVEPLEAELDHFIGCVLNNATPRTDIEHGIRVIENMEKYETQYTV